MSNLIIFQSALGLGTPDTTPDTLFETLLLAYNDEEQESYVALISRFVVGNKGRLIQLAGEHNADAADYVETRDWAYRLPEFVMIAERATSRPSKLRSVFEGSDFEDLVKQMIGAADDALLR
jgi:hypothetical protein